MYIKISRQLKIIGFFIFVSFIGLNHEQNMKKMRLLTFMQLAETNPEMSFDTIQEELQISETEVESFIIDGKLNSYYPILFLLLLFPYQISNYIFKVCYLQYL